MIKFQREHSGSARLRAGSHGAFDGQSGSSMVLPVAAGGAAVPAVTNGAANGSESPKGCDSQSTIKRSHEQSEESGKTFSQEIKSQIS